MKILQIQTQAEAAGAQRVSDMIGAGLRARGHEVRTVFMYRKTAAYDEDPNAVFISLRKPGNLLARLAVTVALARYIRAERPDALITYQHYGNVFGSIAGKLAKVRPIIANQSGNPGGTGFRRLATWLDKLFGTFGIYQGIVVNSAATQDAFSAYPHQYVRKLARIDHGVHTPPHTYDKNEARQLFGLPSDARLIVTTGRLAVGKNQHQLLEALCLLPDVHLALAGAGPLRAELEDLSVALGVRPRVHFVGELPIKRIPIFLAAGDVFAFASTEETFGLSVVEAAIAGVPVIASDIPVLREVLAGLNGEWAAKFFEPGNVEDIAENARCVLSNYELAIGLTKSGTQLSRRYSPEEMVAAYDKLLRDAAV